MSPVLLPRLPAAAACVLLSAALAASAPALAETPSKSWLSIWNAIYQPLPNGSTYVRTTQARLFNPADPADPLSPMAKVKVTYFQHDCWGPVAATEQVSIPPGQHGSFSTLFAAYPSWLGGTGCLWISSNAPIVPQNARVDEAEWATEADFWRTGKIPATRWTSYWEHANAIGGAELGGTSTSGWVLNPARQTDATGPLPSAQVTVTLYIGACGVGQVWKSASYTLAPGQFGLFNSSLPRYSSDSGAGCLFISSDQPVVPLHGELREAVGSVGTAATTFQPVAWTIPGALQ